MLSMILKDKKHQKHQLVKKFTLALLAISVVGCAGPQYAPVSTRVPVRNNPNVQPNYFPAPAEQMANQYPANQVPQAPIYAPPYSSAPPVYNQPSYPNYSSTSAYPVNNVPTASVVPPYNNEVPPKGYYRVMMGDTIYKIAREHSIAPKDLITWNALEDPNSLQPYQLIRISPSTSVTGPTTISAPKTTTVFVNTTTPAPTHVATSNVSKQNTTVTTPVAVNMNFIWPVKNAKILNKFNGKGIDFSGRLNDPVMAAGGGTVIFANKMRGYGNLIIVAHTNDIVTAYAHLQHIHVKEQQNVQQGQVIGSIGNTQSEQVKLHFEVRKKSEPVDPIPYIQQK
jgi:lipoprotein NlpD